MIGVMFRRPKLCAMGSFWHPFAKMGAVDGHEMVIDRADGVYVYDEDGKRYLDGTAALWFCNIGYGREEVANAVATQMRKLHAYHSFGDYATRPALDLADRLAAIAPVSGSKVFLASGGSDAVDTAAKLARRYFFETGQPERTTFLVREWGYHGTHGYGTSLAGMEPNRTGHGPMVEDVVKVEWDSVESLVKTIDALGAERVAGFYCEPVIGAGGVRAAPEGYLKEAREVIEDVGGLFVADEVITGFGRVGAWFASERFSLEPDLITFAKGVTSGYAPLGGVIASARIAAPFWREGSDTMWRHGYTYSGHAASCAAALATLDIMEREQLVSRALDLEVRLTEVLEPLGRHPFVSEVRSGTGVLAAVQIDQSAIDADPSLPARATAASRDAGVITRALGGGSLQVSPPLTINDAELDELVTGLEVGLDACS